MLTSSKGWIDVYSAIGESGIADRFNAVRLGVEKIGLIGGGLKGMIGDSGVINCRLIQGLLKHILRDCFIVIPFNREAAATIEHGLDCACIEGSSRLVEEVCASNVDNISNKDGRCPPG